MSAKPVFFARQLRMARSPPASDPSGFMTSSQKPTGNAYQKATAWPSMSVSSWNNMVTDRRGRDAFASSASPETVFSCEPSLSVVSDPTTAPSLVVATETVTVVHASEAPRYVQSTRHGTRETQVDSVPMLVMSMNDAVGAKDGSAVVGLGVGVLVGLVVVGALVPQEHNLEADKEEAEKAKALEDAKRAEEEAPSDTDHLAGLLAPITQRKERPGMHVVHVTAELAPVAKVGGLADVVTGLGRALQAQGGGPVDWPRVEAGLFSLRRTGFDMVSSPGGTVDGTVRAEYARWRRAKGDSPLQPLREGPETSFQINPSTHDTCNGTGMTHRRGVKTVRADL